jgi:hypothetical protein
LYLSCAASLSAQDPFLFHLLRFLPRLRSVLLFWISASFPVFVVAVAGGAFVSVSVFVSIGLLSVLLFTEKVKPFSHFVLSAPKFGFRSSFSIPAARLGSITDLFLRWVLLVKHCSPSAFVCRGSCFSAVGFSGARDFVLRVSFHRIRKSHPAWSWSARREFSFPRQSARAPVLVSPMRSPSLHVFLGPFFLSGLEFSSAAGRALVRFCSRHGFVFAQDSTCACARKSLCTSPGSVPISFLSAAYAAGFQVPIHFSASVAPAVLRQVLPSALLSAQEEAYLQRLARVGSRRRFLQLCLCHPLLLKAPFYVVQFYFSGVRILAGGFLVLFLSHQIKKIEVF